MFDDHNHHLQLPKYEEFTEMVSDLDISVSNLHGIMCGFLCAGADKHGETYLQALSPNNKNEGSRNALLSIFSLYSISQQQIADFNFDFDLLLPDAESSLMDRASAFSEWCEGFVQGLSMAGVDSSQFYEEEAQEALQHITEFAELDAESLDVNEEDEKALMEVTEYTRMAVLRLHADLMSNAKERGEFENRH